MSRENPRYLTRMSHIFPNEIQPSIRSIARVITVPIFPISVLQISRIVENRAEKALRSVSKKLGGGTEQSLATGHGTGSIWIHGFHPPVW